MHYHGKSQKVPHPSHFTGVFFLLGVGVRSNNKKNQFKCYYKYAVNNNKRFFLLLLLWTGPICVTYIFLLIFFFIDLTRLL
ncbi:hypothetical protein BDA99DRAFT_524258 [Phascolomyces articulosus]|uniref:Uncharacterized protein n=1 Tax=Phascolomyces articulosus TaxID=60185 RepID=A0AAD5JZI8_9FUNG|nr:hypothetical protein BDA99DRAFT_524258 [Phascolomyces articulosus]